jgi:hypothetical protein
MPTPQIDAYLGIENDTATRGFLELAQIVKRDPVLAAKVKTWILPGISEPEVIRQLGDAPGLIVPDLCPALEMWPAIRDGTMVSNINTQATLEIRVRLFLAGVWPLSAMNLWARVQRAVYPPISADGNEVRRQLGLVGFYGEPVLISQPALITEASEKLLRTRADGTISVTYKITGS